jgi:hypothetical protein
VIDNQFLTQTDVIHRLSWFASPDPTVTRYILDRNGRLIATIPAGPSHFVYDDHDRKNHRDTYELFAVNATGPSAPVIIIVGG